MSTFFKILIFPLSIKLTGWKYFVRTHKKYWDEEETKLHYGENIDTESALADIAILMRYDFFSRSINRNSQRKK
jgi:hypothetical protein